MNLAPCSVILHLSVHTMLAMLLRSKLKLGEVTLFVQIHTNWLLIHFSFHSHHLILFKWSRNQGLNSDSCCNSTSNYVSFAGGVCVL